MIVKRGTRALLPVLKLMRPSNRLTAEIWADYRAFKAAGLLKEWRRKWAAYLTG